jgi:hypothetical protein
MPARYPATGEHPKTPAPVVMALSCTGAILLALGQNHTGKEK